MRIITRDCSCKAADHIFCDDSKAEYFIDSTQAINRWIELEEQDTQLWHAVHLNGKHIVNILE